MSIKKQVMIANEHMRTGSHSNEKVKTLKIFRLFSDKS
jgi:hypothetical protein